MGVVCDRLGLGRLFLMGARLSFCVLFGAAVGVVTVRGLWERITILTFVK